MTIQSGGAVHLDTDVLRHLSSIANYMPGLSILDKIYDVSYKYTLQKTFMAK